MSTITAANIKIPGGETFPVSDLVGIRADLESTDANKGAELIGFSPITGGRRFIGSPTVQGAINEIVSDLIATSGAELIGSTAAGFVSANTVQGAINEIVSDLTATSGAGLIGYMPAGTGAVATTVQTKLRSTKSLLDFGGVADYSGIPQYDGADASRVTATDNTVAFQNLINAAIVAGHDAVRIPAGHWGIKTGNLSFSNFNKLKIYGDGIGVTILDFIKEDSSGTFYVDNEGAHTPNVIASFTTGSLLEFADMTIKATTKVGIVNGTSGPANAAAVYYGKVWGFKVNNVKNIRLNNIYVERFNYRGFSIYGLSTELVELNNCKGFYNTSTGYWVTETDLLKINGGEFAYNGILGDPGTGYGVTGSKDIGNIIAKNGYYHHNYSKGLDSHGCGGMHVLNNVFEDNVVRHVGPTNWCLL